MAKKATAKTPSSVSASAPAKAAPVSAPKVAAPVAAPKAAAPSKATKTAPAAVAASCGCESKPKVTHDMVAKRAYEIWESKGRPVGRDTENWQQAERELGLRK